MNYSQIKKLDEDTARELQEGSGPVNECLCSLLAPPDEPAKGIRGSIKRALASMGGRRGGGRASGGRGGMYVTGGGQNTVEIPLTFDIGGKGIYTTKEEVKRRTPCGKCGCDREKMFMKTSYANIRITSPDVSSMCPCPNSACMPGKDKLNNNISVTVERMEMSDVGTDDETTKDQMTNEKTTQVQVQKRRSFNNMVTEKPSLKDRFRNMPKIPSSKDQKDGKIPSNKDLAKEKQKRLSFKELHQSWKSLKEDNFNININSIEREWRENKHPKQQNNLEGKIIDVKKNTSRLKDHDDVGYSVSFSGRMEEQHEDVLRRPYHN